MGHALDLPIDDMIQQFFVINLNDCSELTCQLFETEEDARAYISTVEYKALLLSGKNISIEDHT